MNTIAVVGLGYVGLPLAVAFGKLGKTIGFDLSPDKIAQYRQHNDPSGEVSGEDLKAAIHLICVRQEFTAPQASRSRKPPKSLKTPNAISILP